MVLEVQRSEGPNSSLVNKRSHSNIVLSKGDLK